MMKHLFRGNKKRKSRNKITVRAVLSQADQVEIEVAVKPKKWARIIHLPLRLVQETRTECRYQGGPIAQYTSVVHAVYKHDVPIQSIPYPVRNLIRMRASRVPVFREEKVDARLWKLLMPFQREGVERAIGLHYGRVILADEMRVSCVSGLLGWIQCLIGVFPRVLTGVWAKVCKLWSLLCITGTSGPC